MFEMRYPADIRQDPEGRDWVVKFPDLPGTNTGADTLAGAVDEAGDCLGSWLAARMAARAEIPNPSPARPAQQMISVPLWLAPKLALYRALQEQGISNSELGQRLGVGETVVRRMLDPDHATKAGRLEAALRVVGKRILVVVDDAA
jgi:antitoxin HicB